MVGILINCAKYCKRQEDKFKSNSGLTREKTVFSTVDVCCDYIVCIDRAKCQSYMEKAWANV